MAGEPATEKLDDSSSDGESEGQKLSTDTNDEPKRKMLKLSLDQKCNEKVKIKLNQQFFEKDYMKTFKSHWENFSDFKDKNYNTELFAEPFRICILQNFLSEKHVIEEIVNEMAKVEWSRKQMDLYEFYQSQDLSNGTSKYLKEFFEMLQSIVKPWMEKVCNMKFSYVSASCSMYNCGDYLLVHDDLLKDRQLAFVFYISPWKNFEEWNDEMGGCLEIFNTDSNCYPHFPTVRKITPKNNQFVFFKVGSKSFHQVGENKSLEIPRLTINGWFHGEINNDAVADAMRPFVPPEFKTPNCQEFSLSKWINGIYLKDETKRRIQRHIEEHSEISLEQFLSADVFDQILNELKFNESLVWIQKGPASSQSYEILDLKETSEIMKCFVNIFGSSQIFQLLYEYTDLDLAGKNAKQPSFTLEIQKWSHGSYTVLGDGSSCDDNILDLILYFNATDCVGVISYLSPEDDIQSDIDDDDSALLTITPKDNALSVVYRSEGTTKFTKYVSKRTKISNGPVFIMSCSYKE